jgi:hypothetical protein
VGRLATGAGPISFGFHRGDRCQLGTIDRCGLPVLPAIKACRCDYAQPRSVCWCIELAI